eukprot:scaffold33078_cov48-Attheya_sp.AAC.4
MMGRNGLSTLVLATRAVFKSQRIGMTASHCPQGTCKAEGRGFHIHGLHFIQNAHGTLGQSSRLKDSQNSSEGHDIGINSNDPHLLPFFPSHMSSLGFQLLRGRSGIANFKTSR